MEFEQYECGDCKTKCKVVGLNQHIKYNKGGKGNCDAKIVFPDYKNNIVNLKTSNYIVYNHGKTRLWCGYCLKGRGKVGYQITKIIPHTQQNCASNVTLERREEVRKRTAINYKARLERLKQKYIKQGAEETKRKYEGGDLKDALITKKDDLEQAPITKEEPIEPRILRSEAKKNNKEAKPRRIKRGKGTNEEKVVRRSKRRQQNQGGNEEKPKKRERPRKT